MLMERLAGEMDADEAMALIEAGNQPLNDLLAAMHTKALVAELERRRGSEPDSNGRRLQATSARWRSSRSGCWSRSAS